MLALLLSLLLLLGFGQAIYRTLSDEPDGMVGLDVMRGAAGVAATLKQRIWQYEHAEDWAGALEVWQHLSSFCDGLIDGICVLVLFVFVPFLSAVNHFVFQQSRAFLLG